MNKRGNGKMTFGPSFRLPLILFVCICGTLVGLRWIKEMKLSHQERKLELEVRTLNASIHELNRDIMDLNGRYADLITRDAMRKGLADARVSLQEEPTRAVISVKVASSTTPNSTGGVQ
jgi:hypothetical protein